MFEFVANEVSVAPEIFSPVPTCKSAPISTKPVPFGSMMISALVSVLAIVLPLISIPFCPSVSWPSSAGPRYRWTKRY